MRVLVLNAGSSSLKVSFVEDGRSTARADEVWSVAIGGAADRGRTLAEALTRLGDTTGLQAAAHRVVHGGSRLTVPTILDDEAVAAIEALSDLAPLHNLPATETIRAARLALPAVPHVACFDTAFHATLPESERRYPLPERWWTDFGIRRYGFHGLSVAWSVGRAAQLLGQRSEDLALVVAHLGSGCSVTAVLRGRSMRTSMGFTPLEGLMMGTRAGSVDPGILLHLLAHGEPDPTALGDVLERGSGLLGVSGLSGDLRAVQVAADAGDGRAGLAIEMFVARASAGIAAAAAALPRLDAVAFTGGIGEHAGRVRAAIVERLAVLGAAPVSADEPGTDRILATVEGFGASAPLMLRIEAREDLVAARAVEDLLSRDRPAALAEDVLGAS